MVSTGKERISLMIPPVKLGIEALASSAIAEESYLGYWIQCQCCFFILHLALYLIFLTLVRPENVAPPHVRLHIGELHGAEISESSVCLVARAEGGAADAVAVSVAAAVWQAQLGANDLMKLY